MQKRNLGEVAKVLGQVAAAKLFGGENLYLLPMNNYISDAIARIGDIWNMRKLLPSHHLHPLINT